MNAIWHGSAKDRKAIIKSFKTFMVKTAMEEHGHMALLAMLVSLLTIIKCTYIFAYLTKKDENRKIYCNWNGYYRI